MVEGIVGGVDKSALSIINSLNNTQRLLNKTFSALSTGTRTISPGQLIQSSLLDAQIQPIQTAIENTQNIINFLDTADSALSQVSNLLSELRSVTVRSLGPDVTQQQKEVLQDQANRILDSINRISSQSTFGGTRIFSNQFLIGEKSSELTNVNIRSTNLEFPAEVTVNVVQSATRASAVGTIDAVQASDVTFKITGNLGTAEITVNAGATREDIVAQINNFTEQTGVEATASGEIRTVDFGSNQTLNIQFTSGKLSGITEGLTRGTDVVATVDGATVTGRGNTVVFNSPSISGELTVAAGKTGSFNFTLSGGGFAVQTGVLPNQGGIVRFQIPNVATANLGVSSNIGSLSSVGASGANSLLSNPTNALKIINAASSEIASSRGQLGSLSTNLLQVNADNLENLFVSLSSARSSITDANLAVEATNLLRQRFANDLSLILLGTSLRSRSQLSSLLRI